MRRFVIRVTFTLVVAATLLMVMAGGVWYVVATGLSARPAPLPDAGVLVPGGSGRASLAQGSGVVFPIAIAEAGLYRVDLYGLGRTLTARLEDADGWPITKPGPMSRLDSPKPLAAGIILTGRGIAYSFRNQTVVAQIAEVEVNRRTGHVWVKRLVCAHDCGLVINPEGLRRTIECGMLHSLSRALHEEVQFDGEKTTGVDWISHPSLRHADTPAKIDVVLVNGDPNPDRSDLPHYGAGETVCKPCASTAHVGP